MPTGVHAQVRRAHEARVLRALREHGAQSRGEIAARVGLSRTTLSEITGTLLERGAIVVVDTDASRREGSGRPAQRLALDPRAGQFLGVDFGHHRVHVAVADASHEVLATGSEDYAESADWATRTEAALDVIHRIQVETGVHYTALHGIGIGMPGPFRVGGAATPLPHTDSARAQRAASEVSAQFAERFSAPVVVDNNTRFAALGEAVSGDGTVTDLVYLRLSHGVGGGMVLGGRLYTGSGGLAGELGHVTVDHLGAQCRCGKQGCLETVASVPALLAACRDAGADVHDLEDLAAAVARSHPAVDQALRTAGSAVGKVLAAATIALNPEEIVIGGEVASLAPVLVDQVRSVVAYELFPGAPMPIVRAGALADGGGTIGALAALFHSSPLLAEYPDTLSTTVPGAAHGSRH